MTPADLRHALRTPLNHIIGFAEIAEEDGGDAGSLTAVVAAAKGVVTQVQNAVFANPDEVSDAELNELRGNLLPALRKMSAEIPGNWSADLDKIRHAINRLLAFGEGHSESLDVLTEAGQSPQTRSEGTKGNLLIVDDDSSNRDILKRHLERQGYGVTTTQDGPSCLSLLATGAFDLVLLDVQMPAMDGFEVLKRMRESPASRETPVVMISALDETAGVVRCIQMGAEDYLTKPFDPVLLNARIGASLEKKRLRDDQRRRTEELQAALEELRRTQAQLVAQEQMASLGALTAGIAHEIRNPLNFVTNFAAAASDLIQEIPANPNPEQRSAEQLTLLAQYVTKIGEHGKRAERIVRSMLLHSRGRPGQTEPVDINCMLSDCLNLAYHGLRAQNPDFNVRFETRYDQSLSPVRAVPQELSRVFINVVGNACYAAYARKKREGSSFEPLVSVHTRSMGSMAEIRVADNGDGIDPGVLPKIFNPFFTTKPAGAGTGLGLSLSYDIVVLRHKGTLRAESEPGRGAEFIITLPSGKAS